LGVRGCGDPPGGASSDSAIVKVAVHDPGVVLVPAVGAHVAAVPRAAVPFMNCTVLVGPAPPLVLPATLAVSVTLPPEAIDVGLEVTVVVVACAVTVTVMALDVDAA
jgi:hypothetical protein